MQLCEGRPADARERLEKERRTYDLLDSLGIRYWRTDHAPAGSIAQCQEIDAVLDTVICKNLFLCNRQETQFYLLMMPGERQHSKPKTFRPNWASAACLLQRRRRWRRCWM